MRLVNRLLALLFGLALLAGGLLLAAEAVLAAVGRPPWLIRFDTWLAPLQRSTLGDPIVLAIAFAVAAVGLLLLFVQVRPWAPRLLAIRRRTGTEPVRWSVYRRSVERQLCVAVDAVAGVGETTARLRGKRSRWRLTVSPRGRGDSRGQVREVVAGQLDRIAAPLPVKLRVSMRRPRRVA
ncbi:hypothetical protein Athai_49930 [Actinocatenispora thailandica]|uniref:DUF6286 domain-containing protein n=1 Tax=Actinocatenispora thailandica TaxID=227318 RepID=A0A7R7DTP9_9ACTN|nr:DUF6286 domain-containing protein [Actinocatenispora thailandica]BCJ37490.1 hypothetical protein Athai_49930 [Actinocatenispora thailandica]